MMTSASGASVYDNLKTDANPKGENLDQVVNRYAPLVKRIAHHLLLRMPAGVQVDDLIQSGMIGLLEAAKKYDVSKGASFETYAGIRIRGSMLDEVRKGDWAPRSVHRKSRKVAEAIKSIELNPNLDGAYHVLARWNREVDALPWYKKAVVKIVYGGLPKASNEDAVKNFKMAIELRPDRMLHYFELGATYKNMGEKENAKMNLEKTLSMDLVEREDEGRQEKAKKLLSKL